MPLWKSLHSTVKQHTNFRENRSYRKPDKFAANACQEIIEKVFVILSQWPYTCDKNFTSEVQLKKQIWSILNAFTPVFLSTESPCR